MGLLVVVRLVVVRAGDQLLVVVRLGMESLARLVLG